MEKSPLILSYRPKAILVIFRFFQVYLLKKTKTNLCCINLLEFQTCQGFRILPNLTSLNNHLLCAYADVYLISCGLHNYLNCTKSLVNLALFLFDLIIFCFLFLSFKVFNLQLCLFSNGTHFCASSLILHFFFFLNKCIQWCLGLIVPICLCVCLYKK